MKFKSHNHPCHHDSLRPPAILAGIALIATAGLTHAADFTWNVESGIWNAAASWLTGDPPATGVPAAADDAMISNNDTVGGSPVTVSLGTSNRTINSLAFQSTGTTSIIADGNRNLTIAAGLTLPSGVGAVTMSIAANASNGLQISADQTWTNHSTLSITSLIRPSVSTESRTLTLTGSGSTDISGAGRLRDGLTLIKEGAGTLALSGTASNYTYTGELSIRAGTLSITAINNPTSNGMLGRGVLPVLLGDSGASTGTLAYLGGNGSSNRAFTMATGGAGAFEVTEPSTTLTLTGVIDGAGELRKTGPGTLLLTSFAETFSGPVVVAGGTLRLDGITDPASAVSVTGGALAGTGTVGGTVSVAAGGSIAPATTGTIGTLSTGSLTFAAGGIFDADINTNSSAADQLIVNGDLNLAGAILTAENVGTGSPQSFAVFTIATYTGQLSGTFAGLAEGATVPVDGRDYTISYVDGGNNITLTAPEVIGTPFDQWAMENISFIDATADATPQGDPDDDGVANLVEFALNGDPLSGSENGRMHILTTDTDADTQDELILTLAVRTGAPAFEGSPSPSSAVDGILYTIEGSTSLVDFTTAVEAIGPVTTDLPAPGFGYEYRSFRLTGSNGLPGKGFLRAIISN